MTVRLTTLGLSLTACLTLAAAIPPADHTTASPDCPVAQPGEDIRDFRTIGADDKAQVLEFSKSFVLDKLPEKKARWGYSPEGKAPMIGKTDERLPETHFEKFDHPKVQPRPDDPTWRTYCMVLNKDSQKPARKAIPGVHRPDDENWLNERRKPGEPGPDPAACKIDPRKKYRFASLPTVTPPDTIRVTYVETPDGIFPPIDPYLRPPGTNMLPTVYSDAFDGDSLRVPNSLPSSVAKVYNLHDGDPVVTPINPRSPTNDLQEILDTTYTLLTGSSPKRLWERLDRQRYEDALCDLSGRKEEIKANRPRIKHYLKMAIDIIEGNAVADRRYSGFPLLHHSGHKRVRRVMPVLGKAPYIHPDGVGPAPFDNPPAPESAPKDAAPKDAAPKDAAPKDAAPKDAAPKDAAPKDAAPKDAAPKGAAPKGAAPKDAAPKDAAPKDAALARVSSVAEGNAQVHQVWYDGRIESDTMFLDWQGEYDGCEVRVILDPQDASEIPKAGKNLMVVSEIKGSRHFRLFDRKGVRVLDDDESTFHPTEKQIEDVIESLAGLTLISHQGMESGCLLCHRLIYHNHLRHQEKAAR